MNGSKDQLRSLVDAFRRAVGNRGGVHVTRVLRSSKTNLDSIMLQLQQGNVVHMPITDPVGTNTFIIGFSEIDSTDVIG
jgi:hypothetical protein